MSKWFGSVQVGACAGAVSKDEGYPKMMQQPIRLGVGGAIIPSSNDLPMRAAVTGAGGLAGWLIAKSPLGVVIGAALGFLAPPLLGDQDPRREGWQGPFG